MYQTCTISTTHSFTISNLTIRKSQVIICLTCKIRKHFLYLFVTDEPHRRITIIINKINQQQSAQIRQIFQIIQEKNRASHLLREIDSDQANVILVKSTPRFMITKDGQVIPMMGMVFNEAVNDWEDEDDEP